MNIRGIRIGPGEIYTVLRAFRRSAEEALAVEQTVEGSRAARRRCGC